MLLDTLIISHSAMQQRQSFMHTLSEPHCVHSHVTVWVLTPSPHTTRRERRRSTLVFSISKSVTSGAKNLGKVTQWRRLVFVNEFLPRDAL